MNRDLENKRLYQDALDEVHAPSHLLGKVKSMTKQKDGRKAKVKKYVCAAAAALALLFVSSNAVTYAATGSSWVKMMVTSEDGEVLSEITVIDEDETPVETQKDSKCSVLTTEQ